MILLLILLMAISFDSYGMHYMDGDTSFTRSAQEVTKLQLKFFDAVDNNRLADVRVCLISGIDINCVIKKEQIKPHRVQDFSHLIGKSAVCIAVQNNASETAGLLLKSGACVHGPSVREGYEGSRGCFPLHMAVKRAFNYRGKYADREASTQIALKIIGMLLSYGADYGSTNYVDNNTVFHRCAEFISREKDVTLKDAHYGTAKEIVRKVFAVQLPTRALCSDENEYRDFLDASLNRIASVFKMKNVDGLQASEILTRRGENSIIFSPDLVAVNFATAHMAHLHLADGKVI